MTRFAPEILLIRAENHFSYQSILLRWPIMYQFEFMDSTETRMGKANYIRVLTSQELPKFVGTLHPLPEVTKTLNNREPQKVPRERAECIWGFNTGKTVSIWFPGSTHIIATLPHIILLMFLFLYFVILYILNMNFKIFFHQNNFGFLQNSLGASRYKIQILTCYLLPLSFGHALSSLIFNYFRDFLDFQQAWTNSIIPSHGIYGINSCKIN